MRSQHSGNIDNRDRTEETSTHRKLLETKGEHGREVDAEGITRTTGGNEGEIDAEEISKSKGGNGREVDTGEKWKTKERTTSVSKQQGRLVLIVWENGK